MNKEGVIAYRADIDGLRSLAVVLVLVFHFKIFSLGKGGFLGVDIFFVISGYLITSIIWNQLQGGVFKFKDFYLKRIRRLFPALFVVILLCLAVGLFVLLPSEFEELSRQVIFTQLYSSNFYFWKNLNYFGLDAGSSILLHTWSLAVEEQFYLFFPVVFFILYRYQRNFIVYWFIAGVLLSFFLNIYFVEEKPETVFYLMPTRAWELLAGSLLVFFLVKVPVSFERISSLLGIFGLSLILFSVFFYSVEVDFPGSYALFPVVGSMLLILSGCSKSSFSYKIFSNSFLVYIGKISYSLYLVHWPVNVFASMILADSYSFFWRLIMLALTFCISALIYHFIESPVRKGVFLKNNLKNFSYYFSGVALTVALCVYFLASGGAPWRLSKEAIYFESFTADSQPEEFTRCYYDDEKDYIHKEELCVIGDRTAPPSWILIGDSHAMAASPSIDLWLKDRGFSGYFLPRYACPPLLGIALFKTRGECYRYNKKAYSFIKENDEVKNALLVSTWLQAKEGVLTFDPKIKLDVENSIRAFNERFSLSIEFLGELGINTYIWAPVPGAKYDVPKSLAKAKNIASTVDVIEISRDEYIEKFDFFYDAVHSNNDKEFTLIPVYDELCKSGRCRVLVGNTPLYYDNAHISYSSRKYWAELIGKLLDDSVVTSK